MKPRLFVLTLLIALAVTPSYAQRLFSFAPVWEVTAPVYSDATVWNPATGDILVNEWDNPAASNYVTWVFSSVDGASTGVTLDNGGATRGDFFAMAASSDGKIYGQQGVLLSTWSYWANQTAAATDVSIAGARGAKITGTGNDMRMMLGATGDCGQCRVWGTSDNGFTWSQIDLLPPSSGKSIHVEDSASTVAFSGGAWDEGCVNDVKRFTRISSATDGTGWERDEAFAPPMSGSGFPNTGNPLSADYDEDDDVLITMGYSNDRLCIIDGTTGDIIAAATAQNDFTYYGNVTVDAAGNRAYFLGRDTGASASDPHSYLACWEYQELPTPTPTNTPIIAGTNQWSEYR